MIDFAADREVMRMNIWKCLGSSSVDHEIAENLYLKYLSDVLIHMTEKYFCFTA